VQVIFKRRSDKMPPLPKVVKHHPKGVGLVKIEELVRLALAKVRVKLTLLLASRRSFSVNYSLANTYPRIPT
jgi:DNA topoisomerase VI subunit B